MERSEAVLQAMLAFYHGISTSDVGKFDRIVSTHPATMIRGTAPGEIVRERDRLRFGFETEGVTLKAGASPEAYREGGLGWAFDEPLFGFPDGTSMRVRLTMVFLEKATGWMLVHGHFSSASRMRKSPNCRPGGASPEPTATGDCELSNGPLGISARTRDAYCLLLQW